MLCCDDVKVKGRLLFEQKKLAAFEQRKREQESRKYAREVQAERLKQKSAEKKARRLLL
jgi:rRNA-processing protein EBP2